MNLILILLSTYLSRIDQEIINLERNVSSYIVSLCTDNENLIMTGTIVDKNHIATVGFIDIGQTVKIEDKFGKTYKGEVIGRDPSTGIHLIRATKEFNAPQVRKEIKQGQICLLHGNSFGSMGLIGIGFLQSPEGISFNLSVPLSPGNNGAGVFDTEGRLLGIVGGCVNRSVFPENLFNQNKNFAEVIKIQYILNTLEQIKRIGVVKRAWLGVTIVNNAPLNMGVIVKEVIKDSPAEKAGIKKGDIIISVNGNNIPHLERLKEMILIEEPGNTINLKIIRGDKKLEIPVKLEEIKEDKTGLPRDFKIEKITPKEFAESKEKIQDVLTEKILNLTKELEKIKEDLEKLK
ncbi:MAG: PDZ domain-containing protein [candidate division WOR-3 bacterium]|jgi:serine protease Do